MKKLFATYIALLVLLALTLAAHSLKLPFQTLIGFSIAAGKVLLIAWVFMSLRTSSGITRLAAVSGILWVVFFYLLSALDFYYRPNMPGSLWR